MVCLLIVVLVMQFRGLTQIMKHPLNLILMRMKTMIYQTMMRMMRRILKVSHTMKLIIMLQELVNLKR